MFQHQFNKTFKKKEERNWKSKTQMYFKTIKETI